MYLKLINLDEFNLQRSMILEIYDWLRSISIFLGTAGKLRFPGERISIIGDPRLTYGSRCFIPSGV